MRTRFWESIQLAAAKYGLDPILVEAVVVQESAGNCDAFRFEKDFWNRLMKGQPKYAGLNPRRYASSYGLMQVMWTTAVERGWPADLPPELLFVPETALTYGCRQLRHITDRMLLTYPMTAETELAILASYNGGFQGPDALRPANKAYALAVLAKYDILIKAHHQ